MHSRVVGSPLRSIRPPILYHTFPRSSSDLDPQDTPQPYTWLGPTSSLSFSRVSWQTVSPPGVN